MSNDASSEMDDEIVSGDDGDRVPARLRRGPEPRWKRETHKWARNIHVYTSMIALLVVLFFGFSGITLNHPTWTLGDGVNSRKETGTLPIAVTRSDGSVRCV